MLPISLPPAVPLPTPTAGHVARSLARAEPFPRPAVSEPMLHTLVSQSINRHNLRIFDPKIPPRMNAHFAAVSSAGQPSRSKESADWPQAGNTSRQIRVRCIPLLFIIYKSLLNIYKGGFIRVFFTKAMCELGEAFLIVPKP